MNLPSSARARVGRRGRAACALVAALTLAACGPFGGKGNEDAKAASSGEETTTSAGPPENAAKVDPATAGQAGGAEQAHAATGDHQSAGTAPGHDGNADAHEPAATTTTAAGKAPAVHWTYNGAEGPAHWGDLDPSYATCKTGKEQSPINIERGAPAKLEDLQFAYTPSPYKVVDNGHTIQVNLTAGGTMTLDGVAYTLLQFHFHAPSEHQMGGANYPMEVHLVHRNDAGQLAVVGAFIQKGDELNTVLAPVFDHLPAANASTEGTGTFDATKLLPDYRGTIRYAGSLTTPPCSEGVRWNVLVAPISVSADQVKTFTARHPHSNRPVQELEGRGLQVDLEVVP